jgi:protoheme IX farnesyltransferase
MTDATTNPTTGTPEAQFGDYVQLLKPRVMSLVVFTALVGLLVAPGGVSPMIGFSAILFIALGAGASGALNMWYDADIDIIMKRTRGRPVPSGRVEAGEALSIGIALSVMSVAMLGLATNWLAAGLLAFTIFFYAVIYTMWLKRLTPQNIVIGGAAGAFPPLIGWVAVTGAVSVEAVLMFGLIFMWTPPQFWALALFMKSDYHEAKVPMLTVTHGRAETRRQIWIYSLLLAPVALGLGLTSVAGPVYLAAAVGLNAIFLKHAFTVWRRDEATAEADGFAAEKRLFRFSLSYLFLHFGALLADAALRLSGVLGV